MTDALSADIGLLPKSFVAVAKQAYACPLVSPETVIGEVILVPKIARKSLAKHAAVKLVIGKPPSSATLTLMEA